MTSQVASTLAIGRSTVALRDSVLTPRIRRSTRPVVYLHGAGADATEAVGVLVPSVARLLRSLVRAGHTVVAPTATLTWGNATCAARVDDAVAWARAEWGANADPPVLIGASHGAACALTYARTHDVAGVVAIIPAVDLEAIRTANTLGLRGGIDTAWGVVYPAALPAGANPAQNNPNCPVQLWYATDDAVSANTAAYATAVGADLRSVGALGHTDAAIAAATPADVLAFIGSV